MNSNGNTIADFWSLYKIYISCNQTMKLTLQGQIAGILSCNKTPVSARLQKSIGTTFAKDTETIAKYNLQGSLCEDKWRGWS